MYGKFYIPIYLYNWPDQGFRNIYGQTNRVTDRQTDNSTYRWSSSKVEKLESTKYIWGPLFPWVRKNPYISDLHKVWTKPLAAAISWQRHLQTSISNCGLHTSTSSFNFILQTSTSYFNFQIQLQTSTSIFIFKIQLQFWISTSDFKLKHQT